MVDALPQVDTDAARLNSQCQDVARMDEGLQRAIRAQGDAWQALVQERCPHLFASAPVFIGASQWQQMRAVIAAVEAVVASTPPHGALGVFYGYDFHLNAQGAHLIEINTNAGGGFLNALLIDSQHAADWPGTAVAAADPEQRFLAMFRNEWRLTHGAAPLTCIAIVDERPEAQYLYPEFLLAQRMFERAGIVALVADPADLQARDDGVYCNGQHVDLIYNRLTDFDLQQFPHLRSAWTRQQVVLTPDPAHYARYADKRNLAQWSDAAWLRATDVPQSTIDVLLYGIPLTRLVHAEESERWWTERKAWFFKPVMGYGSKGAYRGDKITRRVFEEIMQGGYVAQRLQPPGERVVCLPGSEPQSLKYDVRCYVYDGELQLAAARLYQGQTTNFRTLGGGFAPIRRLA